MKHEHYGNFIVADTAPHETDQRATARMNSALVGVRIASRPLPGVSLGFLAEILTFQTLNELRWRKPQHLEKVGGRLCRPAKTSAFP